MTAKPAGASPVERHVRPLDPASGTAGLLDGLWFTPQAVLDAMEGKEPAAVAAILGNPPYAR
jgi:hypothetical protein